MNIDTLIFKRDEMMGEFAAYKKAGNTTYEEAEKILKEFCTEKFYELETEEDMDVLNLFEKTMMVIYKKIYDMDIEEDEKVMETIFNKYGTYNRYEEV